MKYLAPVPKQYVDESGIPYSGGTVSVYLHGTPELADIYSGATGEALMENPCTLDSNGSWQCFVPSGVPLDYVVMDADGNVVSSFTNVVIPEGSGGSSSDMEVVGTPNEILVDRRRQKFVVALSSTIKNAISDLADSVTSVLYGLASKANKVTNAVYGNFAGLDANGNLTDSRKNASDFATAAQGAKADTAYQKPAGGIPKSDLDSGVQTSLGKADTALQEHQDISGKANKSEMAITDVSGDATKKNIQLKSGLSQDVVIAHQDISGKVDKVDGKGLSTNDFTDADKEKLDNIEAGAEVNVIETIKVNGTDQTVTGKAVDISVPTASTATPLKDGTASAGSSSQWARGDHVHPTDDSREAVSNKKQVVNDSSTTEYPSSKAVADFVNSSVATNTANFLGTISESSLGLDYTATNEQIALALNVHTWVSAPTNNDYCFVSVNDPQTTDVDEYRRFKFNGSVWAYEYTLNNSSFTQAQWDAINSGLTSSDRTTYNAAVTLLNTHVGDSGIHVTSSEKNAWNAKQDTVSTDTDSSAFGDNTSIATGFSSNKLHLNIASRLWTYIQGKISSVLGLTASSYGGKAATAVSSEDSVLLTRGMYAMEAASHTIPDLIDELKVLRGARCGSVRIDTKFTQDNVTIAIGWYNFEYLPHRGNATGDSTGYGTLLLTGMTVGDALYVLRRGGKLLRLTDTEGSYPNMSVGNAATASAAASGSALETAINSKADSDKSVAIGDVRISRTGQAGSGWYKVAETPFNNAGSNVNAVFDVYASRDNSKYVGNLSFCVRSGATDVTVNYNKLFTDSWSTIYNFKIVVKGIINAATIEIWASCTHLFGGVALVERNTSTFTAGYLKNSWSYTSHLGDGGTDAPVSDSGNNVYVYDTDIVVRQDASGDASNTTSTFTKDASDTSSMSSGSKLSALFTAISSFFASVLSALGGKADKVSGAPNGNLASLDGNGNLTDSGKKAADFAVSSVYNETNPGNLRSFIKFEGIGTQFYRKLARARAVNNIGNSSMIKLEGCVGAWSSGDTTDFSIVVRTRGTILFEASVFKRIGSNNAFDKVNFELYEESDGSYSLWLNSSASYTKCAISAFATGDGASIVYDGTDGTPTGTLVSSASQNYKVMMVTDGDGTNTTSTFTKASGDTSTMTSGSKLSALFTAISSFFASVLSALGGKADKVSGAPNGNLASLDGNGNLTNSGKKASDFATSEQGAKADTAYQKPSGGIPKSDLDSGVQASLGKADTALQEHQDISGKADKSAMNITEVSGDETKKNIQLKEGLSQDVVVSHQDISGKVDKVDGKGLSTNDFTDADKEKLDNIEAGAEVNVIETIKVNGTDQTVTGKAVDITVPTGSTSNPSMDGTASAGSATTYSKSDHVHPTDTSREATANKVSSWSSTVNDTHYPSEKLVKDSLDAISGNTAPLVAGSNVNITSGSNGVTIGVQDGTTSAKGAVQLSDSVSDTSTTKAATANAVKQAYDAAQGAGSANVVVGASATATANAAATNGNVYINFKDSSGVKTGGSHKITGAGLVSVTSDANGNMTVTGSDPAAITDAEINALFL